MTKNLLLLSFLFLSTFSYADKLKARKGGTCAFAEIAFDNPSGPKGNVLRSGSDSSGYNYDFYRFDGSLGARSNTFFFPMPGGIWDITLNIYDKNDDALGRIRGQTSSPGNASFIFVGRKPTPVAYGSISADTLTFTIVSPTDPTKVLSTITRHPEEPEYWDFYIDPNLPFDKRIVKVFAGFFIDYAKFFETAGPPVPSECYFAPISLKRGVY